MLVRLVRIARVHHGGQGSTSSYVNGDVLAMVTSGAIENGREQCRHRAGHTKHFSDGDRSRREAAADSGSQSWGRCSLSSMARFRTFLMCRVIDVPGPGFAVLGTDVVAREGIRGVYVYWQALTGVEEFHEQAGVAAESGYVLGAQPVLRILCHCIAQGGSVLEVAEADLSVVEEGCS